MTLVSQPLSTPEWCFPIISNKYEARLAGRKRGHEAEREEERQEHMDLRGPNKKAKVADLLKNVSNASNASNNMSPEARAPHESLAGAEDWRYEPFIPDPAQDEFQVEEAPEPIDVEKVITILLQALHPPSATLDPPMRSYRPRFTSPLSNSPDRVPFVRKSVGGSCPGRLDPGLQRWVLSKNHYEDVRTCHPSRRSPEWIEALHEMGWENLHPTYMLQSQEAWESVDAYSISHNDWIEVDVPREDHCNDESHELEREGELHEMGGVREDVWDLDTPSQMTTPLLGA